MAETRMEGSRGSGKINVDMKNSEDVLSSFMALLSVNVSSVTNTIPMPMILINGPLKQGLSATQMATNIISRQEQALEQRNYNLTAGGISEAMEFIRCQEIVKAIQTQMRVDIGTLPSTNAAGPIPPIQGYGQAY